MATDPKDSTSIRVGATGLPNLDNHDYESTSTRQTETNASAPISTRANARPTLTVVVGADAGRVVRIARDETTIGRATSCDLVLPDPGVSRMHARLVRTESGYVVEDLGSKNGTYVDAEAVKRRALSYGETVQIGPHVLLRFDSLTFAEEALSRQLYESSMRDPLTRAYNRRYLVDRLSAEVAFANRHRTDVSLVIFDFDHFKRVNDTFGHAGGDAVLQQGVARVLATLRAEDVLARIGGEEFAFMLRGISGVDAIACAERVRTAIAVRPVAFGETPIKATASFGVASLAECEPPAGPDQLFAIADQRLYEAKRAGRNRVVGRA